MGAEPLQEVWNLAQATGLVAAGAFPLALLAALIAKRSGEPILPPVVTYRPRWTGAEALLVFAAYRVGPAIVALLLTAIGFYSFAIGPGWDHINPTVIMGSAWVGGAAVHTQFDANLLRKDLWAFVFVLPLVLLVARALRRWVKTINTKRILADFALGVTVWACLTPVVFAVHLLANWATLAAGMEPDVHPLTLVGQSQRLADTLVFVASACVVAPWLEEFLFRGILIPWALRRRYAPGLLAAIGFVVSLLSGQIAAMVFAVLLGLGLAAFYFRRSPRKRRTTATVWATAAVFAIIHGNVWPTPIPLFVLGLGLGYIVARTGRVTPTIVAHGLFNAISTIMVLRGQT